MSIKAKPTSPAAGTVDSPTESTSPAKTPESQASTGSELSVVALCGDSITAQLIYSVLIEDYLLLCHDAGNYRVVQCGYSGEKTWGFWSRITNDVCSLHPEWVLTCYGMNDGGFISPAVDILEYYRDGQREVVRELKRAGIPRIVVGSPGCVDTFDYANPGRVNLSPAALLYNQTLARLRDIAREVAIEEGVHFADVFTPMMNAMTRAKEKYGVAYSIAPKDGIHPAACGHLPMAYAFLKAMGCEGDIGTISMNLVSGHTEASSGHRVISEKPGVVELESTRYPFCFFGNPTAPDATSGMIQFLPFNEDLNRFQLLVTEAKEQDWRVTWGTSSKQFTASQLRAGINLTAEFQAIPFCEAFQNVDALVRAKQRHEQALVQIGQGEEHEVDDILPSTSLTKEQKIAHISKAADDLRKKIQTAIVPVRHLIRIEPAQ